MISTNDDELREVFVILC